MEARIAHLGGSACEGWRAERQMMVVLASLGMVPDSAIPFIEGLDEADRELAAQQIADFTRLSTLPEKEGRAEAHRLVHNSWGLACRHKEARPGRPGRPALGRCGARHVATHPRADHLQLPPPGSAGLRG